ncbi:MAG: 1-acyl-sn-glycerol-3-phosphate acyltransferase [Tepidiformaceae bacterium]
MSTYIVLSRLNTEGIRRIRSHPERLVELREEVARLDGKVVSQFALLGKYDLFTVLEAPDNIAAARISAELGGSGRVQMTILAATDMALFTRLLSQSTETTGPHKWQIRVWAQVARRALRSSTVTRHVRDACDPLTIEGLENLKDFKGPAVYIANHSSHLDSLVLIHALPERVRRRLAFGSAADRWFLKGRKGFKKQGWWNSLSMNSWPIKRGGGRSSLEYGEWLLDKGWSLVIFPEGTRSTTGKMAHFRHGVSLIALAKNVPVVPVYMAGLREIRPKGSQEIVPGPVSVRIGKPIYLAPGTEVPDATLQLYRAMEELRSQTPHHRRPLAPQATDDAEAEKAAEPARP